MTKFIKLITIKIHSDQFQLNVMIIINLTLELIDCVRSGSGARLVELVGLDVIITFN